MLDIHVVLDRCPHTKKSSKLKPGEKCLKNNISLTIGDWFMSLSLKKNKEFREISGIYEDCFNIMAE